MRGLYIETRWEEKTNNSIASALALQGRGEWNPQKPHDSMFRNLGGCSGIALLATQLNLREKLHSMRLGEAITAFSPALGERLDALAVA
jgi:hypothetical protein